ncbi:MAG: hypothetical protein NTV03_01220 [Candidatus Nomurabacteria bacterium]|nr:hypothetical protein [Candidatus Nomurabacteria bacterium]
MAKTMLEEEMERINNLNLPPERKTNILLVKTTALKLSEKLQDIEHIDSLAGLRLIVNEELKILESLLSL